MKKGEAAIYQYLLHSVAADYETVCVVKTGPRGSVLLLQNKQNGKRLVFRRYEGSGEVYQKLLPISCPYLPQIMEVAGENGRVAVLEEYIEGDSLAELLRGARFTAAEAREITWQLCQALRGTLYQYVARLRRLSGRVLLHRHHYRGGYHLSGRQ